LGPSISDRITWPASRNSLRRRPLLVAATLIGLLPTRLLAKTTPDAPTLSDAVAVLERERSAAEQYAVILATVGRKDVILYVRGIQLYADAKADFDGLIAQLRLDLIEGRDPGQSSKFEAALQAAAEKRIAFTNFVSDQIAGQIQGARPGLADVVKVVPDLVKGHHRGRRGDLGCVQQGQQGASRRHSVRNRPPALALLRRPGTEIWELRRDRWA
jgi:hypothetical protein